MAQARKFYEALAADDMTDCYEAAHARLAVECLATTCQRMNMLSAGELELIPAELSQAAADKSYLVTTEKHQQRVYRIWTASRAD